MKYTILGRSGISVSRISMGTHHLNDPADMDKHVQNFLYAYKKGSNGVQGVQTRLKRKDRFESK